ncbi:MAG: CBS domain-containing protein [Gemmatimonadetes bacterium]|nr:CBS domain-containing protein [Gemmatimonadota bacterium]
MIPLEARTLTGAAHELVRVLVQSGATAEPEKLEELMGDSLPREVVPVGPEAFMLHFRTEAVNGVFVALGVAPEPVYREPESTKEARIVFMVVAPPGESFDFLQVEGAFARALSNPEVVEGLLAAKAPEEVLSLPALAEIVIPGYLTVGDVMGNRLLSVRPDQTLSEAAKLMTSNNVMALPVVNESGEVIGLVSHRQLLEFMLPNYVKRASGEYPAVTKSGRKPKAVDPHTLPIRKVMDRSVLCVSEDQTLADVANMMVNKHVDRFPVVREGVLVGFITRGDIVRRVLGT